MSRTLTVLALQFLFASALAQNSDATLLPTMLYKVPEGLKGIVNTKKITANSPLWKVYKSCDLYLEIGTIAPGDTVEVVDWDTNVYEIRAKKLSGFIAWRALKDTSSLETLKKIILKYRNPLQAKNMSINFIEPDAHASVSSDKTSVFVNECVEITYTFNINEKNRVRLQFTDLHHQLPEIMCGPLNIPHSWMTNYKIESIDPRGNIIENQTYYSYDLYKGKFCPTKLEDIRIPAISLKMLGYKDPKLNICDTIVFKSQPLVVKVKPLPQGAKLSNYDFFSLVGDYTLEDSLSSKQVMVGQKVKYSVTIAGDGLVFPVTPPKLSSPDLTATLIDNMYRDTAAYGAYESKRTFVYALVFHKKQTFKFSDMVKFTYLNPYNGSVQTIQSSIVINVKETANKPDMVVETPYKKYSKMILLDVSESMRMEDYTPNRLECAKKGLGNFLPQRKSSDIGVVAFAGQSTIINFANVDSAYSRQKIDSISPNLIQRQGTAIGDAIWTAVQHSKGSPAAKLIIIGDGDNNTGICSVSLAIELAKKYGIKIYTIGVGEAGEVPMGTDATGRQMIFNHTFTDTDLKTISTQTGGKYYWAKDSETITSLLARIFAN